MQTSNQTVLDHPDLEQAVDKEASHKVASVSQAPSAVIGGLNLIALFFGALLQPPQGCPPFLFQLFFMSVVCAMLLAALALMLRFFPQVTGASLNPTVLNIDITQGIAVLEAMACCFLMVAFLSAAFILQLGHLKGTAPSDFLTPDLILVVVLIICLYTAYRLALRHSSAGGNSTSTSEPHQPSVPLQGFGAPAMAESGGEFNSTSVQVECE